MPGTATYSRPNYTSDSAAQYKAKIDAMAKVFERLAGAFAPHEQSAGSPAPDMTVVVDAGPVFRGWDFDEKPAQTVTGFTAPASGTRIDRIVIDPETGDAIRIAGTAAAGSPSPTPPAIPEGYLPCCQIAIASTNTAITNDMITDERALFISAGARSELISFTRAPGAGSGSVSYTGVGFKPRALIGWGAQGGSTNNYLGGFCDKDLEQSSMYGDGSAPVLSSTAFITCGISGDNQSGVVASLDSDGFSITWTQNGAPGGGNYTINVLCLR